jgi:hypothetical protein
MTDARLPTGWTLQAIRDVSGDREAVPLDAVGRTVMWLTCPGEDDERLDPEIVLGFHSLCIVKPVDDEDWYMGSLNADGSVDCWNAYENLFEALRGL